MSAGAVSFTHIIKASEPVASTIISPFFGVAMQVWYNYGTERYNLRYGTVRYGAERYNLRFGTVRYGAERYNCGTELYNCGVERHSYGAERYIRGTIWYDMHAVRCGKIRMRYCKYSGK